MAEEEKPFNRADNVIMSDKAPKPNGNYSHVIRQGNTLHVCGWMGDEPATGKVLHQKVAAQTKQALRNIKACLEASGSSLDKIVRRRIYIVDMSEVRTVDRIWAEWVGEPFPVSTCVGVTALAKEGAKVEIEVDAVVY